MKPNTTPTFHPTGPPDRPPIPAELLETVARALAAALIPHPRQPESPVAREPDFLTAAQLAARLGVSRETVRRRVVPPPAPPPAAPRGGGPPGRRGGGARSPGRCRTGWCAAARARQPAGS